MEARLIALAGPQKGHSFPLARTVVDIGRHLSNHLVVRQISVSRHHCRLEPMPGGGHLLRDLDSLHGTFVNEQAIRSRRLVDGDRITLGESLFLYQVAGISAEPPEVAPEHCLRPIEEESTALAPPAAAMPLREEDGVSSVGWGLAKPAPAAAVEALLGDSEAMAALRELVTRVAAVDTTVLIRGESGTGKELVARCLHAAGPRAARPFVAVNCATLSETLLESELFGHEKGAFTGAVERRLGQFERADGGTLFLDEIGEVPLPLQAKLLRALQEREFERLGGQRTVRVDVRVLAATNRDLVQEVAQRRFRDDLYYRLDVITLTVPPLRDRRADVPLLALHFLFHHARRLQRPSMALSREVRAALAAYDWPGNVRELSNAIERAVVLAQQPTLTLEDLPEAVLESQPRTARTSDYHARVNGLKRELILGAVEGVRGNVTRAARDLGLSPNYLQRLIRNLGLREQVGRLRDPR